MGRQQQEGCRKHEDRKPPLPRVLEMPMLLFGIDLTDFTRDFMERSQASIKAGEDIAPPDDDAMNKGLQRTP